MITTDYLTTIEALNDVHRIIKLTEQYKYDNKNIDLKYWYSMRDKIMKAQTVYTTTENINCKHANGKFQSVIFKWCKIFTIRKLLYYCSDCKTILLREDVL